LFIVERSSPPPGDDGRRNLATFSRDIVKRMSLAVVVAEGGGFRAALVRGVGVALTTLLPHQGNFKFVNDLDAGVRLLEPHLPPSSGGREALVAQVELLRDRIGKQPFKP
jgi:hypothetical protein